MGYDVRNVHSEILIKKKDFKAALKAIKDLVEKESPSWVEYEDVEGISNAKTTEDALKCLGFGVQFDRTGNICDAYLDTSSWGEQWRVFEALAPFMREEDYILFLSQDSELFAIHKRDGKVDLRNAERVVF